MISFGSHVCLAVACQIKAKQAKARGGGLATQKLGAPMLRPLLPPLARLRPLPIHSSLPAAHRRASSIGIHPAESTTCTVFPRRARARACGRRLPSLASAAPGPRRPARARDNDRPTDQLEVNEQPHTVPPENAPLDHP
jgi:hypothetical protein